MSQNIKLTDTGIVELENILNGYRRTVNDPTDREIIETLIHRCGEVMTKAHPGLDPMEPQNHLYYIETTEEARVLKDGLNWAIENNRSPTVARQIIGFVE